NATVGEARKVVATALQAEEVGDISLFLTGKALKDGFPLKRLRIGKREITIYKKDTATLVLLTARAATKAAKKK
ncbi:MAG: hypothetical protein LBF33_01930, partial [Oscillospiraceae bacterium]|nr:hypothetical protein [Oscillospiraceae bacterium]